MNPLLDTIMNLEVFAFIGLMVWLYLRPTEIDRQGSPAPDDPDDVKREA
ncbi:MAG: hypothetical protein AAGL24_03050 [Pseudomonadota bacterium]